MAEQIVEARQTFKLLIVDDHPVIRHACGVLLARGGEFSLVEASDADSGFALYTNEHPDVIIVDIGLPGVSGYEFARRLLRHDPAAKILFFSMHDDPVFAARSIELGAKGFLSKNDDPDALIAAVEAIAAGGIYLTSDIARRLAFSKQAPDASPLSTLNLRELEVMRLLRRGKTMREIAFLLNVSYNVVTQTSTALKQKLGVETSIDLVRIAVDQGFV